MHGQRRGWAAAWAFVSFFLVLSLLTPWAPAQGWGMSGPFFAMIGAASVAYLVPLLLKWFARRLERQHLSLREWGTFLVGGVPQAHYVEAGRAPSTSLIPYEEQDEEDVWDEEVEELWDEEAEEDEETYEEAAVWSPGPPH